MYDLLPIPHDGNERTHDETTCKACALNHRVAAIEGMLRGMTESERDAALMYLRGRFCLDCGSTRGRRCTCKRDD